MGRRIDEQLWEGWRRRLARYEQWSGTVAAFCVREGVSVVAFYQWRRKLGEKFAEGVTKPARQSSASEAGPRFLPVHIAAAEPVEIELPNGVRVRVTVDSARTLDVVLAAAARCEPVGERTEARAC